MTPKDIFENQLANKIADVDMDVIYQFNITGDDGGDWVVDLKDKKVYAGEADDADCTITLSDENFVGLVKGDVAGPQLFMMGGLQIAGDMGLAMKLGDLLG